MISELANQVEAEWEKQNIHAARASDRVANRLRFDILSGKLPAGCRLLPETSCRSPQCFSSNCSLGDRHSSV